MRVVGDNVEQPVVLPIRDALKLADEMELDLIEISPKADPPVCRIADYQKFLYQQKKKAKELKANQAKVTIKEIRFGPQTDDHDYNFKLKHAENFLKEGSKVKAYVFFRGRSIVFKEQGEITFSLGVLFEFTTPNISRPNRNWNWGPGAQAGKFRFARFAAGRADNRAEKEENKKLSLTCRPPFTIFVEDRIRL